MRRIDGLRVGVVGATGMVGTELLALLESRRFPVRELLPFSSGKAGARARFRGRVLVAPVASFPALASCELVFLASSDAVARKLAPGLAGRGIWTIDDSAAFRLDPAVPLIIPEVNASALRFDRRLIAGPNCTMTGLAVAGAALHWAYGAREVRLASYQAVSGAGRAALAELLSQHSALAGLKPARGGRAPVLGRGRSAALPRAIAFNVVPQVGHFGPDGYSSEESKVAAELRKIWSAPSLRVSATAVRVPSIRGLALAAWLTLGATVAPGRARALMSQTPGLRVSPVGKYPTPRSAAGRAPVFAARIRRGAAPRELALWIVSDNLLKGAALNSVAVAEELRRRGWLLPHSR